MPLSDKYNRKIYMLWYNMKRRCLNPNFPDYKYYGAKGVIISDEWLSLDKFKEDVPKIKGFNMKLFMDGELILDKDGINGEGKLYSLETCEFVSKSESNKRIFSRRKTFMAISPLGERFLSNSIKDFASKHNLNPSTISDCLKGRVKKHRGWEFEEIQDI